MSKRELSEMRAKITALIDDIKYQSDNLTDLERLPIIQLKVLLAKISHLTEQTAVLTHYVEKSGRLSDVNQEEVQGESEMPIETEEEKIPEQSEKPTVTESEKTEDIKEGNVEDRLKKIVVTDLNSAIGINEKYLYASELFGGSTEALSETVKVINELQELNQVQVQISELAAKYNWDLDNETVKNFIELVERKFDQP